MKRKAEELARIHLVPLDEAEQCLDCGREANGGLYLAGLMRPLCPASLAELSASAHGQRLGEALLAFNELTAPRSPTGRALQHEAARQLADWLRQREAERRNGAGATP